jgi:hypothetical protein
MAMRVVLKVPKGSGMTTREFLSRAKNLFGVMYSGQEELSFLQGIQPILDAEMHVVNEMIELHPKIPKAQQAVLFPAARRRGSRNRPGLLARNDEADQRAANERVAALRASARWATQVGGTMATDPNPSEALRKMERGTGMDSRPSRRFHYMKQADFFVEDDGEEIKFQSQVVRASVAVSKPIRILATLVPSRSRSTVVRARVDECDATGREGGLASGGVHEFRLPGASWWQNTVLEAGHGLMLPVDMTAIERTSTCSLNPQAAEIQELRGWVSLLETVTEALSGKLGELKQVIDATLSREAVTAGEAHADPMVVIC